MDLVDLGGISLLQRRGNIIPDRNENSHNPKMEIQKGEHRLLYKSQKTNTGLKIKCFYSLQRPAFPAAGNHLRGVWKKLVASYKNQVHLQYRRESETCQKLKGLPYPPALMSSHLKVIIRVWPLFKKRTCYLQNQRFVPRMRDGKRTE